MDEKRKGELSNLFLKLMLKERGLKITPELKREVGNAAKKVNVPFEEAWLLAKDLAWDMMSETFGKNSFFYANDGVS